MIRKLLRLSAVKHDILSDLRLKIEYFKIITFDLVANCFSTTKDYAQWMALGGVLCGLVVIAFGQKLIMKLTVGMVASALSA